MPPSDKRESWCLLVKDNTQEGIVDVDLAVVLDEAQFPEFFHEQIQETGLHRVQRRDPRQQFPPACCPSRVSTNFCGRVAHPLRLGFSKGAVFDFSSID